MANIDEPILHEIEYAGISVAFALPSRNDHISKVLISSGTFYEQPMLEAIAPSLKPGDLIVDAGANIGNHTIFFSKVLKCRVIAFEPIASTAALLEENVRVNGVSDLVEIHRMALGDKRGRAKIASYDPNNVGGTILSNDKRGSIQVCPLDGVVQHRPVRLLKIDVEGMDLAVLKGARTILAEDRPWVVCEAGNEAVYRPIQQLMEGMGYSPTAVYNATDTFLFLPSRSDEERSRLIDHAFTQMMALQRKEREIAARIEQAGRYSERLKRETLAEMHEQLKRCRSEQGEAAMILNEKAREDLQRELQETSAKSNSMRAALIAQRDQLKLQLSQAELDRDSAAQVSEALRRKVDATSAEVKDARAAMTAEREQMARRLADLQMRAEEGKNEAAILLEGLTEAKRALEERRCGMERLAASLASAKAAHEQEIMEVRTNTARALGEATAQARSLSQKLINSQGMLARKIRELADKQRRIRDAHNALKTRDALIVLKQREFADMERKFSDKQRRVSNAHRVMQEQAAEIAALRASLSFRFGVLIVSSLRTPGSAVALIWRIPKLFWRERRLRVEDKNRIGKES